LLILLMGTGDPLMPANPLGMGLDQILDPSRVVGLFAGIISIRGHGFGMAKPNGFEPIAIPMHEPWARPSCCNRPSLVAWPLDPGPRAAK
jgi:hypothetical protein